jgi:hypothetical protein
MATRATQQHNTIADIPSLASVAIEAINFAVLGLKG